MFPTSRSLASIQWKPSECFHRHSACWCLGIPGKGLRIVGCCWWLGPVAGNGNSNFYFQRKPDQVPVLDDEGFSFWTAIPRLSGNTWIFLNSWQHQWPLQQPEASSLFLLYPLCCCCELGINIFCKSGPVRRGLVPLQWWLQILVALNLSALFCLCHVLITVGRGLYSFPWLSPHLGWRSGCYLVTKSKGEPWLSTHWLLRLPPGDNTDHCCSLFIGQCKSLLKEKYNLTTGPKRQNQNMCAGPEWWLQRCRSCMSLN